ncbi:unnamed protein product, partial [Chrysoparadoxa australica]
LLRCSSCSSSLGRSRDALFPALEGMQGVRSGLCQVESRHHEYSTTYAAPSPTLLTTPNPSSLLVAYKQIKGFPWCSNLNYKESIKTHHSSYQLPPPSCLAVTTIPKP